MPLHPRDHPTVVRLANAFRDQVPPLPPTDGPPRAPRRLEVFGVGPDWVQLTWSRLGPGPVRVTVGDRVQEVDADGGPGSVVVDGLPGDTAVDVEVSGAGIDRPVRLTTRTLRPPGGRELLRLATISDVHVGSLATGYLHTIAEIPPPEVPHPVRCLQAALAELTAWGAEHLVIKGDLVDRSDRDKWDAAGAALAGLGIPIHLVPGNHERSKTGDVDPVAAAATHGLSLVTETTAVDHGGVRIVMADTTRPGTDFGTLGPVGDAIVAQAASATGPVLVALHHQLMWWPFPTYLPVGITKAAAGHFVEDLAAANPRVLVTSGHTHRHRRHDRNGITLTEVGSTKDFPGTWAGYQFFEDGVIQTVRRIGAPSAIRWTDHTRRAALGVWAHWSPGRLGDRCFAVRW